MVHQTINTSKNSATPASIINNHIPILMNDVRRSVPFLIAALSLALAGCQTLAPPRIPIVMPPPLGPVGTRPPAAPAEPPAPPVPPAAPLMTPTTFAALPGWQQDDLRQAWRPFLASCKALGSKPAWAGVCAAATTVDGADAGAVRAFFESRFVPQLIRAADGADAGLITGYYEPMLHGARQRGGAFQTPLYRVPDDLLTIDLGEVYPELKRMRLRGRLVDGKVVPYASRADIEHGGGGKALLWVDDPVEAFFLEVQGSGRVELQVTGETVRVAYADQNGHPYKAIGRWLVEQGEMTVAQASAQSIKAWIASHPQRRQELFDTNPSYVFFKEERLPDPSVGPKGGLGVPLTAGRSVAVDPHFLPLGAPLWLATSEAGSAVPMQRLMMAQDTGGAIRGAVRADFFYGFGKGAAEAAGLMKQPGRIWVLMPR